MAQLTECLAIESERKESSTWNKIHLFKQGDFWKAYEWSAWLIATVTYTEEARMNTKSRRPLKVSRMNLADENGTYCSVGFPLRSIEKFIPNRQNFESIDDSHIIITVALPQPDEGSELTEDSLVNNFGSWKESIKVTEKKKGKIVEITHQQEQKPSGGMLSQIMSYPLSERTAVDNIQFIQSLKQQVSAIL